MRSRCFAIRGLVIAALLALAAAAVAQAHPAYRWACARGGGSATPDGRFVTGSPYRVSMSKRTERRIWAHLPDGEFNTPHEGATVSQVPCLVAETVSSNGLYAWDSDTAHGNTVELVDQRVVGYRPGPNIGRFHCDGVTNAHTAKTYETCTHPAGRFGYISVKFTIASNTSVTKR